MKYKYIHLMTVRSSFYNKFIVDMICSGEKGFLSNEHLFIVTNENDTLLTHQNGNVVFEKDILRGRIGVFADYIRNSEYVFLHSMSLGVRQLFRLNSECISKLIWCVWGHDLYGFTGATFSECDNISLWQGVFARLKKFTDKIKYQYIIHKIRKMKAIGIGFPFDALQIKEKIGGKPRILMFPYGNANSLDLIKSIAAENDISKDSNKKIRIMIGHSASPFLQHQKILNLLESYANEDFLICLPLAYGDKRYAELVEIAAKKKFPGRIEILKEFSSFGSYVKFLLSVDVAVFDFNHQAALGNINLLLYLRKKVYLSRDGIIHWAMQSQGVAVGDVSEIGRIPFKDFVSANFDTKNAIRYSEFFLDHQNIYEQWSTSLRCLE